jgi:hypothetical protein
MGRIITNSNGQRFHIGGRVRPKHPHCRASYRQLKEAGVLPPITLPKSTSYATLAAPALATMLANDSLGNCVIASGLHVRGVTSFNSGAGIVFTDAQAIADYSAIAGYVVGDESTDNGTDEVTALEYWRATGFPDGVRLLDYISVDATNFTDVCEAIYLFENGIPCMELPDFWTQNLPSASGFTWSVAGAPDPQNGHSTAVVDFTPDGVILSTWGMTGLLTADALAYYANPANGGSFNVVLTPDVVSKISQKSPIGFDVAQLTQFLAQV